MNPRLKKVSGPVVGMLVILALALAGCSSSSTSSHVAMPQTVACTSVSTQVQAAQAVLAKDKEQAKTASGPAAQSDKATVLAAQQKVSDLQKRQQTCGASTPTAASGKCTTWKMSSATPANGRWTPNGVPQIASATTSAQAHQAADDWIKDIKGTPGTLSGAAAYLLKKTVNPTTLVTNGCATNAAEGLVWELAVALSLDNVTPSQAPSNGNNSLTSNGAVLAEESSGISGNRTAIEIDTTTGQTVWVMARCGNAVTKGQPAVTQPPTPQTVHGTVPVTPPVPPSTTTTTTAPGRSTTTTSPSSPTTTTSTLPPSTTTTTTCPQGTSPGPGYTWIPSSCSWICLSGKCTPATLVPPPPTTTTTTSPPSTGTTTTTSPGSSSGWGDPPSPTTPTTPTTTAPPPAPPVTTPPTTSPPPTFQL